MPLPKRKNTRLADYSYSNGGSYFLTICTKGKVRILSHIEPGTEGDYPYNGDGLYVRVVLSDYGKIAEKFLLMANRSKNLRVERYVIMPNHIHLIATVFEDEWQEKKTPPSETVACFLSMFKRQCNKAIGVSIFQRGANDHVIRNIKDREAVEHYMLYNPAHWYFRETRENSNHL